MRNLIYQYWIGEIEPCAVHGTNAMAAYADRIGAEYIFEHNPKFISEMVTKWASHYSALRPVFDESFHEYDNVLFADCDVFPVEGLTTNIFDEPCADIGICEEIGEPAFRKNDPNFDEYYDNFYLTDVFLTELFNRMNRYFDWMFVLIIAYIQRSVSLRFL